jgi:branched-chain amino acid aminotransferase
MAELTGSYYSENSIFRQASTFRPEFFNSGIAIYEVLRIIHGVALFLEDHIERLQASVNLSELSYTVTLAEIRKLIGTLAHKNNISHGNVKIVLHFTDHNAPVLYTFFIPHSYPTASMIHEGVETDFFKAERRDPNVKKINPEIIHRVNAFISAKNLYDALLVDEIDTITEGSKTNVFFVQGEKIITPPANVVLKGITRQKIFEICTDLKINILEQEIGTKTLHKFQAAFFTGTSPRILPINRIANIRFSVSVPLLQKLMKTYDDLIADYVKKVKGF